MRSLTNSAQRRIVVLKVEDQAHPATRMLGPSWPVWDEFYVFGDPKVPGEDVDTLFKNKIPIAFSRQRHKVLLSVDTDRTNLDGTSMKRGVDYPQSWVRDYGKGPRLLHVVRASRRHLGRRSRLPGTCHRRHPLGARDGEVGRPS